MSKYPITKVSSFLEYRDETLNPEDANSLGLKRIDKINFNGQIILASKATNTKMIRIKTGDLVISGINVSKGALAVYEGNEDVLATIHYSNYIFDPEKINIEYLKLFLKSDVFMSILREQTGGGIKTEIKPSKFLSLKVPLPSKLEQQNLVKNYQAVSSEIQEISNKIIKQQKYVSYLRQSILQAAVEGNLVGQDENDEPASVLLKKIKREKASLSNNAKTNKETSILPITKDEIPFKLPSIWEWCRLIEIIEQLPRNGYSPSRTDRTTDTKVLTLTATTSGSFISTAFKYSAESIDPDSYLWLKRGDILIQRSNSLDYVGMACLYDLEDNMFIYPDLMMKIKSCSFIDSRFLVYALQSKSVRNYYQSKAKGTSKSMPKITQGIVANTLIPLPPLQEQRRIVLKLDKLINLCNKLEDSIFTSKKISALLARDILNQAVIDDNNTASLDSHSFFHDTELIEDWDIAAKADGDIKPETQSKIAARLAELSKVVK